MSYILDAIKKADQKRKLGTVPDVHTEHEEPLEEPRRTGWIYGLAAILIINAGGIGWWLWSGGPAKTAVVQQPEKAAAVRPAPPPATSARRGEVTPPPVPLPPSIPVPAPKALASGVEGTATGQNVIPLGAPRPVPPSQMVQAQAAEKGQPAGEAVAPSGEAMSPARAEEAPVLAAGGQGAAPLREPRPSPPPSASPPQAVLSPRPEEGKPETPAVAQAVAAARPPLAQVPPRPAARRPPAIAADGDAAPPPQTARPAMEEAHDEEGAVVDSDETLDEAGELPEDDGSGVEAGSMGGDEQVLAPVAVSAEGKEKVRKVDRESEDDPELAKIPLLRQMPVDIQQGVSDVHISFHSYSIKPASRLVSIGGKILREGQEVEEGLTLERITSKGVVLSYRGRRFRLNM